MHPGELRDNISQRSAFSSAEKFQHPHSSSTCISRPWQICLASQRPLVTWNFSQALASLREPLTQALHTRRLAMIRVDNNLIKRNRNVMIYLLLLSWIVASAKSQIIHLEPGSVEGFTITTRSGHEAEVFLNIPYAAPPIGKLRFERPAAPIPWKETRNGKAFGPTCYPHARQAAVQPPPSEDCLTLNIIRPKNKGHPGGYPILFWVHGGGYEIGAASLYGYQGFANIYIPHDVMVVTIQYRVGFFSSGDARIPGNLGLFDMAAALKFVHDNARRFGGDPSRITAWGLSAGGSAVGQLALSPVSRDYIAGTIEMSGSAWASWALGPTVSNNSLILAWVKGKGCPIKELRCRGIDLKKCMKQKTVDEIYKAVERVVSVHLLRFDMQSISVDNRPIKISWSCKSQTRLHQMGTGDRWSVLATSGRASSPRSAQASYTIKALSPFIHKFGVKPEDFEKWTRNKFVDFLKNVVLERFYKEHFDDAMDEVIEYYADRDEEDSYAFYLDRYTEFISDTFFNVPAVDGIVARRHTGWDMYVYSFDHYNDAIWNDSVPKRLRGSPHVNEYPYIFELFVLGSYEMDEKEQIVADVIQQSFISFVKTGWQFFVEPPLFHGYRTASEMSMQYG
ncbi:Carboxylesterase [Ancylostoma duodenale]|uniref:Carboxylesterase n=1 Tax=Ancylostoma duodenale TaxID=51022 RepID=A0A0C2GDA1_9BILA|nr:Carboxylesterase [Ancylostoma duodenale]